MEIQVEGSFVKLMSNAISYNVYGGFPYWEEVLTRTRTRQINS